MTRHKPVQQRSRERVEQILLASADLLAKSGGPDSLTTTSVSKRSGVPVATIYRYFGDRSAIIAELIEREIAEIDTAVVEAIKGLERVSLVSLYEAIMVAHLRHFQTHRRAIVLWFGTRQSAKVLERVGHRYDRMAAWLARSSLAAGLVDPKTPPWAAAAIVWLSDRAFEFIFREERTTEEQESILRELVQMVATSLGGHATPAGIEGVTMSEFEAAVGEWPTVF